MRLPRHLAWNACVAICLIALGATVPARATVHTVDAQRSSVTVHVAKRGLFAFLADNHVIEAPIAGGSFDPDARTVQLTIDATKMRVLDPALPPEKRTSVQSNMEGAQVLDAARYPTIEFRSTRMDEHATGRWIVSGKLTLHGQTRPVAVEMLRSDGHRFTGRATIRQSEFGITPIRVAGGAVSVADDVRVDFEIVLTP